MALNRILPRLPRLPQRREENSYYDDDDKEDDSDLTDEDSESDDDDKEDDGNQKKEDVEEFPSKNRFEESDEISDIILVVEEKKLHVSKSLLMIHSPVFRAMFTGDFKERNLKEIPLEKKKYATMVNLLEQIYPGEGFELMRDETLENLLHLAEEYQTEQVFTNCKQFIAKQLQRMTYRWGSLSKQSTDSRLFYLQLAQQYQQLSSLRENLLDTASEIRLTDLQKSGRFSALPVELQRDILMRRVKRLEG